MKASIIVFNKGVGSLYTGGFTEFNALINFGWESKENAFRSNQTGTVRKEGKAI